jgi:hypothetical protein
MARKVYILVSSDDVTEFELTSPVHTIPVGDLTFDELSDLGYYWNDVQAMMRGRTGIPSADHRRRTSRPMSTWHGTRVGGLQLEYDEDTIWGLFLDGDLNIDMYEE